MKKILLLLILTLQIIHIYATENMNDSIFNSLYGKEQLKDSTERDKMYYDIYKANLNFVLGNYTEANEYYDSALVQYVKLENFFKKMKELNPNSKINITMPEYIHENSLCLYQKYRIMMDYEQYNDAYSLIANAYNVDKENLLIKSRLAWFLLIANNLKGGIELYEQLSAEDPYNINYIWGLYKAYLYSEKYSKAIKMITKMEVINGDQDGFISEKIDLYVKWNKYKKALQVVDNFSMRNPNETLISSLLTARIHTNFGKYSKAYNTINYANELHPNNPQLIIASAAINKLMNNEAIASELLMDVLTNDEINAKKMSELIRPTLSSMISDSSYQEINTIFDTLLVTYPKDTNILYLRKEVELAIKDTTAAIKTIKQLKELQPQNGTIDFELLQIEAIRGNDSAVRALAREGEKKYENDFWKYLLIQSYVDTTRIYQDSMLLISKELLPTINNHEIKAELYLLLGDIYSLRKEDSKSMAMYDSCITYNPKSAMALNNLAYNLAIENIDLKRAETLAQEAIKLKPDDGTILDTYAWILYLNGDYRSALFYYEKVIRIDTENNIEASITTHYHYGAILMKNNQERKGKNEWIKALKLYNNNKSYEDKEVIIEMENYINQK